MKTVLAVYKTDTWHSYDSRELIGIATDLDEGIRICERQAMQESQPIAGDAMDNLRTIMQTQSYEGDGEFQMEYIELNKLL